MGRVIFLMSLAATAVLATSEAAAQVRVQYGRVTNVQTTTVNNSTSQNVGTVVGGGIGLVSGSGQSGSNRALRGITGAAAGRGVGTLAGRSQAFEYTVLVDGMTTVRVVSDQAGKRVGDCVAVEQGQFANIRLVPESRCARRSQAGAGQGGTRQGRTGASARGGRRAAGFGVRAGEGATAGCQHRRGVRTGRAAHAAALRRVDRRLDSSRAARRRCARGLPGCSDSTGGCLAPVRSPASPATVQRSISVLFFGGARLLGLENEFAQAHSRPGSSGATSGGPGRTSGAARPQKRAGPGFRLPVRPGCTAAERPRSCPSP